MIRLVEVPPSAHQLADWVELRLVVDDVESVSLADLHDVLRDPLMDEPPDDFDKFDLDEATVGAEAALRSRLHEQESLSLSVTDLVVNGAMQQLLTRATGMKEHSPYTVSSECVRRTFAGTDLVQRFLTLLAARLHYHVNEDLPPQLPAILFERLVAVALKNMLGTSKRFGWPYRDDGIEGNFPEAVARLAELMDERRGNSYSVSPSTKDQGLDVAAWRSFGDGMPYQAVLLCQCGIGKDLEDKNISTAVWSDIIAFSNTPLTALAFPIHIEEWSSEKRFELSRKSGVLLDRIRLSSLVKDEQLPAELREDIAQWCNGAVEKIPRDVA